MTTEGKTIRRTLIFIFALTLFLAVYINVALYNTTNNLSLELSELKESNLILANQLNEATELYENKFLDIDQEIYNLYKMNSSHENCVALALQMNESQVLAEQFDRTIEEHNNLYSDDDSYASYYGRLYIPDVKVDVALYSSHKQYVTDRTDSANIFTWSTYSGQIIADHNSQGFSKIFSVKVGTQGYIQLANGDIINIECVDAFNGYNIGQDVVDENYISAMGRNDYMMYTCRNNWQNVYICLWDIV